MSNADKQTLTVNENILPTIPAVALNPGEKPRLKWPLKTLIEILPIFYAISGIFTYAAVETDVSLVTPFQEVFVGVPLWVAGLMGLVAVVGFAGWVWIIYVFSRAPVAPDGSDEY